MATELPPVGVCTKCGDFAYDAARINGTCDRRPGGKPCQGVYGSAMNNDDWNKCIACGGVGRAGEKQGSCPTCLGTGWNFVRDRRPKPKSN
jgi:hypothetical protein